MKQTALISVKALSKQYDKTQNFSLCDVSLDIHVGDKFGILGPNGAGKTTLISILCGIFPSSMGSVAYYKNGLALSDHDVKKIIGFVPQDFALYDDLTARQNLEYFGALYNLSKKTIVERTDNMLSLLGLLNVIDKKVVTYSGGMKRRLNLAIGLIHNPEILFLDEPTVGVDIQSKNAILNFLNKINEQGATIIYTSHHMSEAQKFCDKIAILDYGKLIAFGTLDDMLIKHNTTNLMDVLIQLTGEDYRDNV